MYVCMIQWYCVGMWDKVRANTTAKYIHKSNSVVYLSLESRSPCDNLICMTSNFDILIFLVDFTKYCIISFRNVQFPKPKILTKAKDILTLNTVNSVKVHICLCLKQSIFPVLIILRHRVEQYASPNQSLGHLVLLHVVVNLKRWGYSNYQWKGNL